jgi:RNA polymerase sigma factor (sigma-70 family)
MSSTKNEVFADRHIELGRAASHYSPMLFRIALRRLRNVEDAEDAVQDALLSAHKHIGQFEGRSELSTWLTRIVINVTRMKLRSRRPHEVVSLDQFPEGGEAALAKELIDPMPNPEAVCVKSEMAELLRSALAQMSPKLRLAFEMREIAGFSTREAAEALNTKTTTLKSRVNRARAAIGLFLHQVEALKLQTELKLSSMDRTAGSCGYRNFKPVTD